MLTQDTALLNPYSRMFETNLAAGHGVIDAAEQVAHAYLDGKPRQQGKRKFTGGGALDAAFWSSEFLRTLPAEAWQAEHLVPEKPMSANQAANPDADMQGAWEAINDLLVGKLRSVNKGAFRLTEPDIGKSPGAHLSPFLFPSPDGPPPREDLYHALQALLAAQMELNSFVTRSADAFPYDDSIEFFLAEAQLEKIALIPLILGSVPVAWPVSFLL